MPREALRLFISYARQDEELIEQLVEHLVMLRRGGEIVVWHDKEIAVGEEWNDEIDGRLEKANLILLLVSTSFLNSNYCYDREARRALERHVLKEACVLPVIGRPCEWEETPFAKLQVMPKGGKPVTLWGNRDKAWLDVTKRLRMKVSRLRDETVGVKNRNGARAPLQPGYLDSQSQEPAKRLRVRFYRLYLLGLAAMIFVGLLGPGMLVTLWFPQQEDRPIQSEGKGSNLPAAAKLQPQNSARIEPDRCYRLSFSENRPFYWVTSGAWSEGGQRLLLVDTYKSEILGVSLQSGAVSGWDQVVDDLELVALGNRVQQPRQIHAGEDGWFLLDEQRGSSLLRLDSSLEFMSTEVAVANRVFYDSEARDSEVRVQRIYDFVEISAGFLAVVSMERTLLGQGVVGVEDAFVYFDQGNRIQVLERLAGDDPTRALYTRNVQLLASLGSCGYIMRLAAGAGIDEICPNDSSDRSLNLVPEEFNGVLDLSNLPRDDPRRAVEIYTREERAEIAVGLYPFEGYLYLLGKEGVGDDWGTTWWLLKVDPLDGSVQGRVRLPTTAAHLTVVPGMRFWALVEKGRVENVGRIHGPYMDISSVVIVPASWLKKPRYSPLEYPLLTARCRPIGRHTQTQ